MLRLELMVYIIVNYSDRGRSGLFAEAKHEIANIGVMVLRQKTL